MKTRTSLALLALGMAVGLAVAQTPPATPADQAPPAGPAARPGMGPGPGPGMGMGMGGQGGMRMQAGSANTPGWTLMTPEERKAHQTKMMSLTSRQECDAYMSQHMRLMVDRAAEKKVQLRAPRRNMCEQMFPK